MIPCNLLFGNVLKRIVPKQRVILSKYYTTESDSNNAAETKEHYTGETSEMKEHYTEETSKEKPQFWDTPSQPERVIETNIIPTRATTETKHFRELLDTLFETRPARPLIKIERTYSDFETVVEKKLLDLILRKQRLYRDKAPLPRSMISPMYSRTEAHLFRQSQLHDQYNKNEGTFDFLNPSNSKSNKKNWDQKVIATNEGIKMMEQANKVIDAIAESQTALELLECIKKEINQDRYPKYYPHVLSKAIDHAARKDPYLALTIFELAKTKSMESYIIGCTTTVYDTILLLRWKTWRDVYGILDLVEEMTVNGVEYSPDSKNIVQLIAQEIEGDDSDNEHLENGEEQLRPKGVYYDADEKRAFHLIKEFVARWMY